MSTHTRYQIVVEREDEVDLKMLEDQLHHISREKMIAEQVANNKKHAEELRNKIRELGHKPCN